jgi:hypothetical protein
MLNEVEQHIKRNNWEQVLWSNLPKSTVILPAILTMHRKRKIDSRELYKWKSQFNIAGHKSKRESTMKKS